MSTKNNKESIWKYENNSCRLQWCWRWATNGAMWDVGIFSLKWHITREKNGQISTSHESNESQWNRNRQQQQLIGSLSADRQQKFDRVSTSTSTCTFRSSHGTGNGTLDLDLVTVDRHVCNGFMASKPREDGKKQDHFRHPPLPQQQHF